MPPQATSSKQAATINARLHRALAHPLKHRILILLTETEASPKQISDKLGESLDLIAYHVRGLAKADLIELVRTENKRSATEHFYRACQRPILDFESWQELSLLMREVNSIWVAQLIIGDLIEAFRAATFDARVERTMVRTPVVLDEKGFAESEELGASYLDGILEIQAKSAARMSNSGEAGFNVATAVLAFEVPPPAEPG